MNDKFSVMKRVQPDVAVVPVLSVSLCESLYSFYVFLTSLATALA